MAVDKKKLKNLFGASDDLDDTPSTPVKIKPKDIFADNDDKDTDIVVIDDTDYTQDLFPQEDEDIYPKPNVTRKKKSDALTTQDLIDDTSFSVRLQQDLLLQAQKTVALAMQNAADGGTARDIEVLTASIEAAGNASERLLSLYEKIQKIQEKAKGNDESSGNTYVTNNNIIFQGTTSDILRQITDGTIDVS